MRGFDGFAWGWCRVGCRIGDWMNGRRIWFCRGELMRVFSAVEIFVHAFCRVGCWRLTGFHAWFRDDLDIKGGRCVGREVQAGNEGRIQQRTRYFLSDRLTWRQRTWFHLRQGSESHTMVAFQSWMSRRGSYNQNRTHMTSVEWRHIRRLMDCCYGRSGSLSQRPLRV